MGSKWSLRLLCPAAKKAWTYASTILSESTGDAGLKTQVVQYATSERQVEVTYVDGLVVRYSMSSK